MVLRMDGYAESDRMLGKRLAMSWTKQVRACALACGPNRFHKENRNVSAYSKTERGDRNC